MKKLSPRLSSLIVGDGTRNNPFNAAAYILLKTLKKDPLANLAKVTKEFEAAELPNPHKMSEAQFRKFTDSIITFRTALPARRYTFGSGTCFLMIKLKKKSREHYKAFEELIQSKKGVIEWDHIPGRNADYLVRVVGKLGDVQMHATSEILSDMPNVKEVYAPPELTVAKSGVIDNTEPDDFLWFDKNELDSLGIVLDKIQ